MSDAGPAAMVVGTFTSVSLNPPLVGFFPDKSSTSWPRIEGAGQFCVNVLGAHQRDWCEKLAAKTEDKLASIPHRLSADTGSPILDGVVAWIDCTLHSVHECGDHFLVLGMVKALAAKGEGDPLLFLRGQFGTYCPMAVR